MQLLNRFQSAFKKQRADSEMEDELRFHLEKEIGLNIARGMSAEEARRRALISLGGVQQTREKVREVRWAGALVTLLQDVRYGARLLKRNPGFTATAVLTLALGIGANTAIFSIVNSVLLHSLPYHDPDQLVRLVFSNRGVAARNIGLSVPELDDLRTRADGFQDLSVVWGVDVNLTGAQNPERLELLVVSPNYFSMLGVNAGYARRSPGGFAVRLTIFPGEFNDSV